MIARRTIAATGIAATVPVVILAIASASAIYLDWRMERQEAGE